MTLESTQLQDRFAEIARVYDTDKRNVKQRIEDENFTVQDVKDFLALPDGMPYGRKLIFQNDTLEAILMNWDKHNKCLPHDHGESEGWVKILKGTASHVYYNCDGNVPMIKKEESISEGSIFFAPNNMVHHMANKTSEDLITLHFYFPPIHNMEVFDIDKSRSAIVSDDCGAWWPETTSKLLEYRELEDDSLALAEQ